MILDILLALPLTYWIGFAVAVLAIMLCLVLAWRIAAFPPRQPSLPETLADFNARKDEIARINAEQVAAKRGRTA